MKEHQKEGERKNRRRLMNNYVYGITHKYLCFKYIGTRSCNITPKEDIGVTYFSSSSNKDFIKEQHLYPDRFLYEILKEFKTRKEAILYEIKLHKLFDVKNNNDFYNIVNQTENGFDGGCGKNHFKARPIYQCDKDTGEIIKIWPYIDLAAQELNINGSDITGCAKERNKIIGGYIWIYEGDYTLDLVEKRLGIIDYRLGSNQHRSRSILQINLIDNNVIKIWPYVTLAAKTLKLNGGSIAAAARGRQKMSGNFKWKYFIKIKGPIWSKKGNNE